MSALHWVLRTTTVEPGQFHGGIVEIERPRAVASNLQFELAILTMLLQHNSQRGFERQRNNLSVTSAGDEVARLSGLFRPQAIPLVSPQPLKKDRCEIALQTSSAGIPRCRMRKLP